MKYRNNNNNKNNYLEVQNSFRNNFLIKEVKIKIVEYQENKNENTIYG